MRNPIRRNRNIGTSKQGHGKNNRLTIPSPCLVSRSFFERLDDYKKVEKVINGHEFTFIIERTRSSTRHACSIEDIENMIKLVPTKDYGLLKLIVLRQPKRKEEIISPVWGRLIYSYEFENDYSPAIILEAIDCNKKIHWKKSLIPDDQAELERLKADGHQFIVDKRGYTAKFKMNTVRNTQLYRTLLHEFGHYVHYFEVVERPAKEEEEFEEWEKRHDFYSKIPVDVKERYAHRYADLLLAKLKEQNLVPFERTD
ncbi:hypothetical protein GO495_00695 [Chitinophaga oryziterrae]|uniref:Uncharacterized protein n=1 Tax=Chitinophaga oryziterrae TaxID=1031224 RepID=A0A6N8J1J6_9BACT|nr:hypothetical protein [Chitinophaga oryziterrae]MVT39085.1 hypothetical protein [Chitinophaga oryziterrae]